MLWIEHDGKKAMDRGVACKAQPYHAGEEQFEYEVRG